MLRARPYQRYAIDSALLMLRSERNTMIIAPTGAGKTFILSATVNELLTEIGNNKRVLVIVHRNTINFQNKNAFEAITGRKTGLFIAGHKSLAGQVTFAMIQTLSTCYKKLPAFDVIVIDEVHHTLASTYINLIEDQSQKNPDLYLFGVTATPNRGDKKGLGKVFSNYAALIRFDDLIDLGYLVPPKCIEINQFEADNRSKISSPDYYDQTIPRMVSEIESYPGRKKIVIFAANMRHMALIAQHLNNAEIEAVQIHSGMSSMDITTALESFEEGSARVLVNIDIATEGYDFPPVDCVVLMTAIGNKGRYKQMVGRGLRTIDIRKYPNHFKKDCLILDFGMNVSTYGSLNEDVDLQGKEKVKSFPTQRELREKEDGTQIEMIMDEVKREIRIYEGTPLEKFNDGESFVQGLCGYGKALFAVDGKVVVRDKDKVTLINNSEVREAMIEVLGEDALAFEEMKNKAIEKHQIRLLMNDFDIVGCSQYRASVLINYLVNKDSIKGAICVN